MQGILEAKGKTSSARVTMLLGSVTSCITVLMCAYAVCFCDAVISLTEVGILAGVLSGATGIPKIAQNGKEN